MKAATGVKSAAAVYLGKVAQSKSLRSKPSWYDR